VGGGAGAAAQPPLPRISITLTVRLERTVLSHVLRSSGGSHRECAQIDRDL
jgi:hypothetical protein